MRIPDQSWDRGCPAKALPGHLSSAADPGVVSERCDRPSRRSSRLPRGVSSGCRSDVSLEVSSQMRLTVEANARCHRAASIRRATR